MTENIRDDAARTVAGQAGYLIRLAARAPSLHNTQPWRFKVSQDALELYADTKRQLRVDPDGRELLKNDLVMKRTMSLTRASFINCTK